MHSARAQKINCFIVDGQTSAFSNSLTSIFGCENALVQAIPLFILFKGKKLKREWSCHLSSGPNVSITEKKGMIS